MRKISLNNLDSLFAAIAKTETLYLPVDGKEGRADYKKWEEGDVMSGALNTARSPKDFFFPQSEDLMAFKTEGKKIEIIDVRKESEDFILFGVKACDVKSLEVLDKVFLGDTEDSYYATKREHATIISMVCARPTETCFCQTFGIDCTAPGGDVVCTKTDDGYCFEAVTEKGEKLLAALDLEDTDTAAADAAKAKTREIMKRLPLAGLTSDAFGAGKTDKYFDDPKWKELSESCLGCGTCTFVCPTCQCYDIKDFNTGKGVIRFRCWDSCMYSEFTKMSAGQPRLSQKERFRQRFMHKLVYFPERYGMFSCVGCGRCLARCPISMNIVKVMKAIGGEEK